MSTPIVGLIDFSQAFAAFAGELHDHQDKGADWESHDPLFHIERALKHFANATVWLKAGRIAEAKEDIHHGQSRAIMATELYERQEK